MSLSLCVTIHAILILVLYQYRKSIELKTYYIIVGCILTSFVYGMLYCNLYIELNSILEQIELIK